MKHQIEFVIRKEVSICVLYRIIDGYGEPALLLDDNLDPYFIIELDKDAAFEFYHEFEWAMEEMCDMNQDTGENYLIPY